LPKNWEYVVETLDSKFRKTEITEGPKFNFISQEFKKTLNKEILKIETLQIPFLWQSFDVGLEQTKNKNKQID
jgi:hypothetical protein